MTDQTLLHPLFPAISSADRENGDNLNVSLSSAPAILLRVLTITVVGAISLWANYEASKGFSVTIINDAKASPAGKKFHLFYVSNDEATRIILNADSSLRMSPYGVGRKKEITHLVLRFSENFDANGVSVAASVVDSKTEFEIRLSSSFMEENDFEYVIRHALRRAVEQIWLWRDEFEALPELVNGTDEYSALLAGFGASQVLDGTIICAVI